MEIEFELEEILPCVVCHEDAAYLDHEGNSFAYVVCPICGSQSAPCAYDTEEEKQEAERKVIHLWNMGKVIREARGE